MKRSDLRTGMLVELNNGSILKVYKDTMQGDVILDVRNEGNRLKLYDEDNVYIDYNGFTISKIYKPKNIFIINSYDLDDYELIWDRNNMRKYIKAVHFGSTKLYTWIATKTIENDIKVGDIIEVDTEKGYQLVEIRGIYEGMLNENYKYAMRKVVI